LVARLSKPDRPVGPVEPGIGPASGPADAQKRSARGPEKKPLKPGKTEKKTGDPGGSAGSTACVFFLFFFYWQKWQKQFGFAHFFYTVLKIKIAFFYKQRLIHIIIEETCSQ
jgi:hypothetical protein